MFWEALIDLLAQLWLGIHRMHRGGLGESPRGIEDFRRSRRVLIVVIGLCVAGFFAYLAYRWLKRG